MSGFAQGSRSSLSFIEEATFGTTPAGNFTNLPFTTQSLNLSKERVQGNDIQADRMTRVDRHGNRMVEGDIVCDLRNGDYDALLESVMLSTWDDTPTSAPDELKVGTTPKFFSIEDYAADIDQARLFNGCTMSSLNVSIAPNQMIVGTFGIMGKDMTIGATQKTQDAASGAAPFDSYSGAVSIANQGATLSEISNVSAIDFTINNNFNPAFIIGSDSAPCLLYGRATIEGTATFYYEDATIINRFLNETDTAFQVTVNDPTNSNEYGFFFPNCKFNAAAVPVAGEDARFIEVPFVALYDSTEDTNLVIYRPDST